MSETWTLWFICFPNSVRIKRYWITMQSIHYFMMGFFLPNITHNLTLLSCAFCRRSSFCNRMPKRGRSHQPMQHQPPPAVTRCLQPAPRCQCRNWRSCGKSSAMWLPAPMPPWLDWVTGPFLPWVNLSVKLASFLLMLLNKVNFCFFCIACRSHTENAEGQT